MGRAGAKHQTFHGYRRCFFASLERPSVVHRLKPIRGRLPPADCQDGLHCASTHKGTKVRKGYKAFHDSPFGCSVARQGALFSVLCSLFSKKSPHPFGRGLFGARGAYSSVSSEPVSTMSSEVMGSSEDSSAPESWACGKRSARASSASRSSSGTGMVSVEMPFSSFLP